MVKPLLKILTTVSVIVTLYGCPYNSPHTIDEVPQQPVDDFLLGKWATMVTRVINDRYEKEDPVKIILTKRTDMEYDVAITGYISDLKPWVFFDEDTIKGTAFLSTAVDREFINVSIQARNYIAEVKKENGKLSFYPISERFTAKLVKNCSTLRTALEYHYNTRPQPVYDEQFILKNLQRVN